MSESSPQRRVAIAAAAVAVVVGLVAIGLIGGGGSEVDESATPTGTAPPTGTGALSQVWDTRLPRGAYTFGPVTDGHNVYVGSSSGRVTAYSIDRGLRSWSVDAGDRLSVPPITGSGSVFVGFESRRPSGGTLVALDRSSGDVEWRRRLTVAASQLDGGDGSVVVAARGISVFEDSSGDGLWNTSTDVFSLAAGRSVVVGATNDRLSAMDARTGSTLWAEEVERRAIDVAVDDRITVVQDPVLVRAYDVRTGRLTWHFRNSGMVPGLHIDRDAVYVRYKEGGLSAIDPRRGREMWRVGSVPGLHVTSGDAYLFTAGIDVDVRAPSTGVILGDAPVGGPLIEVESGAIAAWGAHVFVAYTSNGTHLAAYEVDPERLPRTSGNG